MSVVLSTKSNKIDPILMEAISVTPEMNQVEELIQNQMWKLTNIPKLISFFAELVKVNEGVFANKPDAEKAEIAFNYYRDRCFAWIKQDEKYHDITRKIQALVSKGSPNVLSSTKKLR